MLKGIVLAAGDATRLANKALLPTRMGIAVESALVFLRNNLVVDKDITVVIQPDSIIQDVLQSRGWFRINYRRQSTRRCVNDAVAEGVVGMALDDQVIVTFCDNIYDPFERVPLCPAPETPIASVRPVLNNKSLDWHDGFHWRADRPYPGPPMLALAGWYFMKVRDARRFGERSESIDGLETINTMPYQCDGSWHDIGTVDSYRNYLRS